MHQGEQTLPEAAKAVAIDTIKAAAAGTVSGAATAAATAVVEQMGKKALVGAPGAAIAAGIEISKDALAWRQGKLSVREVGARSIEHLAGSGGAWGGAAAGAAICAPIPVVGFPGWWRNWWHAGKRRGERSTSSG